MYAIPHETMLFNSKNNKNNVIGIIGIACVTYVISGGWKDLRLGFKPQCVILEHCGYNNHWLYKPIMTLINLERLKK